MDFEIGEQLIEVENNFGTSRDKLPPLFISTPYDRENSIWTQEAPTTMILHRVSDLARESVRLIETQINLGENINCDALFSPPLTEYDCLISLKQSLNSRRLEATNIGIDVDEVDVHPFKEHLLTKVPIVGFDPVSLYLRNLRVSFFDHLAYLNIPIWYKSMAFLKKFKI